MSTAHNNNEDEVSVFRIVVIFTLLGLMAAGFAAATRSFIDYVEFGYDVDRTSALRIAEQRGLEDAAAAAAATAQAEANAPSSPGEAVFINTGCTACHSFDGSEIIGPSVQGLADRAAERIPGTDAETYIHESIVNPCDFVVEGYTCQMPENYGDLLTDEEINDLVAYLLEQ